MLGFDWSLILVFGFQAPLFPLLDSPLPVRLVLSCDRLSNLAALLSTFAHSVPAPSTSVT